jgi:hypothetical protein
MLGATVSSQGERAMIHEGRPSQPSLDGGTLGRPLSCCVGRALNLRSARFHAVIAAAAIASVAPLSLGAAFPPVFPLANLFPDGGGDGTRGFVLTGIVFNDEAGYSVSAAGDVNGDGIGDVIVGAVHGADQRTAGESYVVFGSRSGFPAVLPLGDLYPASGGDGTRGFVLQGLTGGSRTSP